MEFYERVSGARMHAAFFRFGGIAEDLPTNLLIDINNFSKQFNSRINELEELLTNNRIWTIRLKDVGIISLEDAINYAYSGVLVRGSGVKLDLRKKMPYENYELFNFQIPIGKNGDCFDRYILRIEEMRQSLCIIVQSISQILEGPIKEDNMKIHAPRRENMKMNMQMLITHFKLYSENLKLQHNEIYQSIEAPKGEFGIYLVADSTNKPYRCKIRSPGFFHLQGIALMAQKHLLADVVTIIGTQDIVSGEVDR